MNAKPLLATLLIATLLLAGCATTPTPQPGPEPGPAPAPDPQGSASVAEANNRFALDVYARYGSEEGNLFFSPYSISSALAMTYEGAKGQTADEMRAVLHLPSDTGAVRGGFATINAELNREGEPYSLSVANALWTQEGYPFVDEYLANVRTYYGGEATNLDFRTKTEASRRTINEWVEERTNDRIKDLIPAGVLGVQTRMVLTNAIYFKANWSQDFKVEATYEEPFTLTGGQAVEAEMMHQTATFSYGETKDVQLLEMDYLGGDLSMLVLLPKKDIASLEAALTAEQLEEWKADMEPEKVRLTFPKFTFETKYFMANDLKEMGMPTAFTGSADFTAMSPTGELYIGNVIHQTFVEVTEEGTEAAAATAVIMEATSAGPGPAEEPKVFKADHPFIFIIQQKGSGNILFIGRLSDPS